MRKFFFGEIKSQSLNDKGMARYFKGLDLDYCAYLPDKAIIDEDELKRRINNILIPGDDIDGKITILTAPAPKPEKDEWEEWYSICPMSMGADGMLTIRAADANKLFEWYRKMPKR